MYNAKIVLDSVGNLGQRITTFEIEMPKWLVAEFNTHRMLSRNSASSRAIPTKQIIERVMTDPVIPIDFRSKNTGMVANEILSDEEYEQAKYMWLQARDLMVLQVEEMMKIGDGIDKQRINRLLEPWMYTVVVATATEWENFFYLRDSKEAQPEFAHIAHMMNELYTNNIASYRLWHLPYLEEDNIDQDAIDLCGANDYELDAVQTAMMLISAARCGRVSYYRQGDSKSQKDDVLRGESFATNKHWSPLEHPAKEEAWTYYGNLFAWKPLRKFYTNESGARPKKVHNAQDVYGTKSFYVTERSGDWTR